MNGQQEGRESSPAEALDPALTRVPPTRPRIAIGDTLPSAPEVVRLLIALDDGDADAQELLAAIDRDPALTARILRTANSPFFNHGRDVTSVARAVVVLGLPMIRNLTLGLTVWDATTGHVPPAPARRLWEHSLVVADAARYLASRGQSCPPADAFTAGLLHDVGKLVLARQLPDAYAPLLAASPSAPVSCEHERNVVGYDHAEVGALLLDRWRLPRVLVEAVARHHDAEPCPGLPGIVAAANALVGGSHETRATALAYAGAAGVTREIWDAYRERNAGRCAAARG